MMNILRSQKDELKKDLEKLKELLFVESAVGAINGDKRFLPITDKEDAENIRKLGYNQCIEDILKLLDK